MISYNNLQNYVANMRNKNINKLTCKNEENLLHKCILCKNFLSSNEYGPELEKYIKEKLNIKKAINAISGDGTKNNKNIEIKVSLSNNEGQLNFLQIRPDHHIDYYMFLAYNLLEEELGKVYLFLIPAKDIYAILPEFGGYSHGTTEVLGKITNENIFGRNCEYSLRPNPNKNDNSRPKKLWNFLLQYSVSLEECIFN